MTGWLAVNLDYLAFCLGCCLGMLGLNLWLRKRQPAGRLPLTVCPLLGLLLVAGFFLVRAEGLVERDRIRDFLQGVAPTYARELELLGHESIGLDTPADDPVYLRILEAMHRWKQLNPIIADVYTYRVHAGEVRLLVSGPTDYNRDGIISGEREQRVEIGTLYEEADPPMFAATRGQATFSNEPVWDNWGAWVSAQVPLHAADGSIEGAMGLDYPAAKWMEATAQGRRGMLGVLCIPVLLLGFGGTLVGILRTQLDVRRKMEAELAESERRVRGIFEHLPYPFWATDSKGVCRLCNQVAADSYALAEGVALPSACLANPEATNQPEVIIRENDGSNRYYYRLRAPLTAGAWDGGKICMELDVTAHREAELALNESRERLSRHVLQTPLAVIEWDIHHRVLSWNPSAERIFGYEETDALGKDLLQLLVAPADRLEVGRHFEQLIAGSGGQRLTLTNRTRSGRLIQCAWYSTTLLGDDGRLINVASHAEDITEHTSLQHRLQDTRKMESLGQLAGGVAHEFNNLLTPMLIQVGLIEHIRAEDTALQKLLKPIEAAILQASQLTQRVLAVGRKVNDEDELVTLNELIRDSVLILRKTLDERIELQLDLDNKLPAMWVSRSGITQVVMNLILNAKDTLLEKLQQPPLPHWKPLIMVRTYESESVSTDLPAQIITISDNGMGMDPEHRSRIFEPFYTSKPPGSGTGLGLAVVWNVLSSIGGNIDVKSVLGAGSSFHISLPRRSPSVTNRIPTAVPFETDLANEKTSSPLKVLLVDDTPLVVESLRSVIVAAGHRITCAFDGEEAWTSYAEDEEGFDVVITDLNMPRLNGEGLLHRIRKHGKKVGVIILSGRLEPAYEDSLRSGGADRILRKPVRPVNLMVAVTTIGADVRRRRLNNTPAGTQKG